MNNIIKLRPTQPYKIGQFVCIGNTTAIFEIVGFGMCNPAHPNMVNSDEFIQIRVPGSKNGVFNIHVKFLRG